MSIIESSSTNTKPKECWFCQSSIDAESDDWMSIGLITTNIAINYFPNDLPKGVNIDIHKDCFGAFSEMKRISIEEMCDARAEAGICWLCNNPILMCDKSASLNLNVSEIKNAGVEMHLQCIDIFRSTTEIMEKMREMKSQRTDDSYT